MAVNIAPNPSQYRVLMGVAGPDGTRMTVALTPDEARRVAVDLVHFANTVEPHGARKDVGVVIAVNGRGVA